MPAGDVIQIENISKRFGSTKALDDVSFGIPPESIYGLLGPNGAGKTTLFSLIAGFLKPDRGSISVLGTDVEDISELQGRLSILPQDAMFQSNVPIIEQLVFFGRLMGCDSAEAEERAVRSLEKVGLQEASRKNARVLSHGMAQRLGIAQAFLGDPEVVLLDEPTSGLDPSNAAGIRKLIQKLHQGGATIVISSHNLKEIQELCTHFAIIDRGNLLTEGDLASFTGKDKRLRLGFTRDLTFEESQAVRDVPEVHSITSSEACHYTVELNLASSERTQEEIVNAIVQALIPFNVVPRSVEEGATLESRFLEITGDLDIET